LGVLKVRGILLVGGTAMKTNATKMLVLMLTFALGLVFSAPVRAQVAGATLAGTINDAQGGAVVNAKVSVRNTATGVTSETNTNASGAYSIVNLLPGDYQVSVSAAGFKTSTSKVTLAVGTTQELSLSLAVGEITQTVEVTGAAPVVETTNATLSGEVVGEQITTLPLNGRDWVSLAALTPGVVSVRPHEEVTAPGGSTRGLGIQMTINGARPQQNVYRLNGVIVNDYSNAGPGNVLGANAGVDAIQEFSVLTGNYSAEYGDTSGGVINAVTKSGTNSFHGSGYEFLRNSYLDAKNRFEDPNPTFPTGAPKGHFERNQFGASAGWKILKDRAFLFGNYEGTRQEQATIQQQGILTTNARLGIINDKNGNQLPALTGACPYAKYDPNGMTNEAPGKAAVCVDNFIFAELNPCTGVTPCPSGFAPGGLSPLPNGALVLDSNGNNSNDNAYYVSDNSFITRDDYATIRADFKISDKDSLTGSWYRDTSTWKRPGVYAPPNLAFSGYEVPHGAYTLEETHIFSNTLVNTLRAGFNHSDLYSPALSDANPLAHAQTLCVVPSSGGACVSEQIGILPGWVAGGGSVGGNGNSTNSTILSGAEGGFTGAGGFSDRGNKIEIFDDLNKTIRSHTLKMGFEFIDNHDDWVNGPALQGGGGPSYSGKSAALYGGTCDGSVTPLPISCGGGVAAYLMDIPNTVRMPIEPPFAPPGTVHHWRNNIYGAYLQDDWKVKSNLTLNLGIRYEFSTIPSVTDNNINDIETLDQNIPATAAPGACVSNLVGQGQCGGFYHTVFLSNPTKTNFEPRVGFAWDPFHDGKTSIRGGAGIFDVLPLSYLFALNSMMVAPSAAETDLKYAQQPPVDASGVYPTSASDPCVNCLPGTVTPPKNGSNPLGLIGLPNGWGHFPTTEAADVTNPALVSSSGAARRFGYNQPNPKRSYVAQYNLNIQRQITPTITIMVAYAGSKGWHLPFQQDDLNIVFPYAVNVGGTTRYIFPNPVGSGCLPGPPNCSQTDAFLGLPVNYVTPSSNCVNGVVNASTGQGCVSANNGIVPGLLINSNTAQFQSSVFQAQSWYNSLQVRVDKKVSRGLLVGGAFTWAKSFDTSSSSFASDNYSNNPSAITPWWDLSIDKGLSDFNVTKNLTFNVLYTVPTPASFNGVLKEAFGGWGIGANFEASTGIPLWPLITSETAGMLNGGPYDIPDLVPGCQQVNPDWRKTLQYLNPACYVLPVAPSQAFFNGNGANPQSPGFGGYNPGCDPSVHNPPKTNPLVPGTASANNPLTCLNLLGDDPRNVVIGPGLINLDLAVTKDTYIKKISETANLQFRAEFFNIANHPNYQFPVANDLTSLNSDGTEGSSFGLLTKTQSSERQIQFALKLIW
jgi:hypothetical protein